MAGASNKLAFGVSGLLSGSFLMFIIDKVYNLSRSSLSLKITIVEPYLVLYITVYF